MIIRTIKYEIFSNSDVSSGEQDLILDVGSYTFESLGDHLESKLESDTDLTDVSVTSNTSTYKYSISWNGTENNDKLLFKWDHLQIIMLINYSVLMK